MCSLSGIALKVGIIANVPKEKGQYEPFVSNMFLYVLLIHLCFTDSSVMWKQEGISFLMASIRWDPTKVLALF